MEKFLNYFVDCHTLILTKEDKFNDSVKMINHHTDLQIFVDENRTKSDKNSLLAISKVEFYEPKLVKNKHSDDTYYSTDASSADEEFKDLDIPTREECERNIKYVKERIRDMVKNQTELTNEDQAELLNLLHHREVNYRVTEELKTITDVKEYHVSSN
jgi:hypothetical protein